MPERKAREEPVWAERKRSVSSGEKLKRICELNHMLRSFFKIAVRLRNPGFTERQVHREHLLYFVGEKLFNEMIIARVNLYPLLPSAPEFDENQIDESFCVSSRESLG